MSRHVVLGLLLLSFCSFGFAAQPKILEVTDNLGHTFSFEDGTGTGGDVRVNAFDASANADVYDKLSVTNQTKITLCVTKVRAANPESLEYYFAWGGYHDHPDNVFPRDRTGENCHTWNMNQSHYQSIWGFNLHVTNNDNVDYQNDNSDYKATITYRDLALDDDPKNSGVHTYENVQIDRSHYKELQESTPDEGEIVVKKSEWDAMQQKIIQKNQRITELEEQVRSLQQKISTLQTQIQQLNQTRGGVAGGPETTADKNSNGFLDILSSLFRN